MRPILRGGHIWCHKSGITPISCVDAVLLKKRYLRTSTNKFSDEVAKKARATRYLSWIKTIDGPNCHVVRY